GSVIRVFGYYGIKRVPRRETVKRTVSRSSPNGFQTHSLAGQFEQSCKCIATKMQHLRFRNAHVLVKLHKNPIEPLTNCSFQALCLLILALSVSLIVLSWLSC